MVVIVAGATCACAIEKISDKKIGDIDYTIVAEMERPDEINKIIKDKCKQEFRGTYTQDGYTYIVVGYGLLHYKKYSISLEEIYETKNTVVVKTRFKVSKKNTNANYNSYPVIVIKIEDIGKNVVFR